MDGCGIGDVGWTDVEYWVCSAMASGGTMSPVVCCVCLSFCSREQDSQKSVSSSGRRWHCLQSPGLLTLRLSFSNSNDASLHKREAFFFKPDSEDMHMLEMTPSRKPGSALRKLCELSEAPQMNTECPSKGI